MRALTVTPGQADSAALAEVPEPPAGDGDILVRACAVGMCGTDREILAGKHAEAPPGQTRLILGHEAVGRVLVAPDDGTLREGDWVVGIVRHPCRGGAAQIWPTRPAGH